MIVTFSSLLFLFLSSLSALIRDFRFVEIELNPLSRKRRVGRKQLPSRCKGLTWAGKNYKWLQSEHPFPCVNNRWEQTASAAAEWNQNLSHTRCAGSIEGGLNGDDMSRGIQFGLKVYGWLEICNWRGPSLLNCHVPKIIQMYTIRWKYNSLNWQ